MGDQTKAFLYAWLGKSRVTPDYQFTQTGANARIRFRCELRAEGFAYVAMGNSTNKKDAAVNAARDFLMYLVREKRLPESELPFNNQSPAMANPLGRDMTSASGDPNTPMPPIDAFINAYRGGAPPPCPPNVNVSKGFMSYPEGPKQEYIDRIAQKRKFEEAEELDVNSGIHGNWTLDNAKQKLNEYM
ncbi:unnamed protein product, partial [Oppiella nova]